MQELWEILVPHDYNDGSEVPLDHHLAWDEKVRELVGGLTILKSAKGIWVSKTGEIYKEKMIPVRIACTEAQARQIGEMTIKHYDQLAVMLTRVSDRVIFLHRE